MSERRRASFRFSYEIRNEAGDAVATGATLHACWDPATSKMIAVPDWLVAGFGVESPEMAPHTPPDSRRAPA